MRNKKSRLIELSNEYDVQIQMESGGCFIFYKNIQEADVIPFTDEVDDNYILDNFEMVADLSKLQLNVHQIQY